MVKLSLLILLCLPLKCFAAPDGEYHAAVHSAHFFPLTKRSFFIDKSMVEGITKEPEGSVRISELDEPIGMLILEATQIIDLGDPYSIKFKSRRDFDDLYRKYIDFSQIFTSLQIPSITLPKKIPYAFTDEMKYDIPPKKSLYTRIPDSVNPEFIYTVNYWLKVPIKISLKTGICLTSKEQIYWNLALKFAQNLADNLLPDVDACTQMHELWRILPILFPKV